MLNATMLRKIRYLANDALNVKLPEENFDLAISFETIEHLKKPKLFLKFIFDSLKPKGRLICSVPNQTLNPYDKKKYPYHFRHYTQSEMIVLLKECGFYLTETFCQKDRVNCKVQSGPDGTTIILVALKH